MSYKDDYKSRFISRIDNNLGVSLGWPNKLLSHHQFVNAHGELLVHETGIACPRCRVDDQEDFYGKTNCPTCSSGGFLYRKTRQIMGIVTGISSSRHLQDFGWAMPGDCVLGLSPFLEPGVNDFDKITFTWPIALDDGETIVRGIWHQRFPNVYGEDEDLLSYEAVEVIGCVDEDGIDYYYPTDSILENRKLIWINKKPIIKKRYTVKYKALFEWIVFNPEFIRVDSREELGSRVVLRKRHVAFLKHKQENQPPALRKSKLNFNTKVEV